MPIDITERYKLVFRQLNHAADYRVKIIQGLSWIYITLAGAFAWLQSGPNKSLSYIVPAVGAAATLLMWLADIRNCDGLRSWHTIGEQIEDDPAAGIPKKEQRFFKQPSSFVSHSWLFTMVAWIIIPLLLWLAYHLLYSQGVSSLIGTQPTCDSAQMMTILGLILTLTATIFLFLGSQHRSWRLQTWNGESEAEKTVTKKKQAQTNIGFLLLFFGFLSQLIGIIIQKR